MTREYSCDITILITCYNEEDLIVATIESIVTALKQSQLSWEVIVIDDVSKDGSTRRVQAYIDSHPEEPVRLHANKVNRGLANNFIDGAFLARGRYFRFSSGDNPEPPEALACMLKHLGQYDIIVPYHGRVPGRGFMRRVISSAFTMIVNVLSGYRLKYYNGSSIYRTFHVLRYPPVTAGFGFQADLITRLLDGGASYIEVTRENIVERKEAQSTALSMRNLFSVMHCFCEIVFRVVKRKLFPRVRLIDDLF